MLIDRWSFLKREGRRDMANAKQVQAAKDSTEVRMYNRGEPITRIMAATGKNYQRVKEILDLAGCPARTARRA
jgi:hypothetical protein